MNKPIRMHSGEHVLCETNQKSSDKRNLHPVNHLGNQCLKRPRTHLSRIHKPTFRLDSSYKGSCCLDRTFSWPASQNPEIQCGGILNIIYIRDCIVHWKCGSKPELASIAQTLQSPLALVYLVGKTFPPLNSRSIKIDCCCVLK